MKTIEDLIGILTPEERALHAELIAECIEREAYLKVTSKKIQGDLLSLQEAVNKLLNVLEQLYKESSSLKETCCRVNDRIMAHTLSRIPDEYFFHA